MDYQLFVHIISISTNFNFPVAFYEQGYLDKVTFFVLYAI